MGYGKYRRRRSGVMKTAGPPQIKNTSTGFIVSHREYIQDINASQSFVNVTPVGQASPGFALNPGNASCFPWLAQIAENFEEWIPRGIIFEFKTTSSDAVVSTSANAALGTVIMATEYNPYNGFFANKQQMENYQFSAACKPSCTFNHQVECSSKENPEHMFYVRTGPAPTGADYRLYDLGEFQIATVGMQANGNVIGELWVTYEIEFKKPRIAIGSSNATTGLADHFQFTTNITPGSPFGTATTVTIPTVGSNLFGICSGGASATAIVPTLDANGNPTGALTTATQDSYYFNPGISTGNFMIYYISRGGAGGTVTPDFTPTYVNCSGKLLLTNDTDDAEPVISAVASALTQMSLIGFVTVTKANAKITFVFAGAIGAASSADFYVTQIPDGIT